MNVIFKDPALKELYETGKTKNSRYKYICKDERLLNGYRNAVYILWTTAQVQNLRNYSNLHYEKLKYRPESSVRLLNGRLERLLFIENENCIEVELIEIDNTHYGNKR